MKPAIDIQNLGKQYKRRVSERYLSLRDVVTNGLKNVFSSNKSNDELFWALQDINLKVMPGERVGIIGSNGAGKSTLLKIISRITPPTTGEITLHGRVGSLLEVGTGFHPELTGRENIFLNGSILGLKRQEIKQQLDAIIDFSGVEKFIDSPLKHYSSGMQMRLAFAVAAHLESEILLIDEVLAVGDAEFQKKCIGKMEEVSRQEGRTILFVSHSIASLQSICQKGVLLAKGELAFTGNMNETCHNYLSFVRPPNQPLSERTDRQGNGKAILKAVEILNKSGIQTGDSIQIKIEYHSIEDIRINSVGISIWDSVENRLISISSSFKNQLKEFPLSGTFVCEIPFLPLVKGRYFLNAFIESVIGLEDYVERIIEFEVEEKDFFGTGNVVHPEWGKIIVDHNWIKK